MASKGQITKIIEEWRDGDASAFDRLLPLIYEDLRRIARRHLRRQGMVGGTISTTALVHELYLKIADRDEAEWRDRAHFFAVASRAMRHILIDYVRHKGADKRGGDRVRVTMPQVRAEGPDADDMDLLALDRALSELSEHDERQSRIVECRFFGGMTVQETAEALGVGVRTVERDWTRARAYLYRAMERPGDPTDT